MNFNDFIQDPKADLSVATLAMIGDNLCFVIQPQARWGKTEFGQITLPFGGIGGKVELGEDLLSTLSRECQEEIGCDCQIIPNAKAIIPVIDNNNITFTKIDDTSYPLPEFIFKNLKSEPDRKDYTYVFVYRSNLVRPEHIQPLDNPAIIMMTQSLFQKVMHTPMTLREAQSQGAIVRSSIPLPAEGILWPTPTPRGYYRLLML
ncbi:MAG: NUDIX domain-containing protein [Alphaproteobacteria bacterium]|nr:NUDIX domain-containing protein [Alphaproteobacteria bacterium]